MESLYACLFSNGHIKVGRSIDPESRIASHVDRVSCMGVELVDSFVIGEVPEAAQRETMLIGLCAAYPGAARFKSEWFAGLDFAVVVAWAKDVAGRPIESVPVAPTRWAILIADLKRFGMTQTQIAKEVGCGQPSISDLANGAARDPAYSLGEKLIELHRVTLAKHCQPV